MGTIKRTTKIFFQTKERSLLSLPKWAQDYIHFLRDSTSKMKDQVELLQKGPGSTPSPLSFSPMEEWKGTQFIPENSIINFRLFNEFNDVLSNGTIKAQIKISHGGTPKLLLRAMNAVIFVKPEASNSVSIFLDMDENHGEQKK